MDANNIAIIMISIWSLPFSVVWILEVIRHWKEVKNEINK